MLADHEGMWEPDRWIPAAALGLGIVALAVIVAVVIGRVSASPGVRRLAVVGVGAAIVAVIAGTVPAQARGGSVICGPVLHVAREDGSSCGEALGPMQAVVTAASIVALISLTVAAVAARSRPGAELR